MARRQCAEIPAAPVDRGRCTNRAFVVAEQDGFKAHSDGRPGDRHHDRLQVHEASGSGAADGGDRIRLLTADTTPIPGNRATVTATVWRCCGTAPTAPGTRWAILPAGHALLVKPGR